MEPILSVRDVKTHFFTRSGVVKAVDGVGFDLMPGRVLGLVGESGSGKSVMGFSLVGLIDPPGRVVAGSVRFAGRELVDLPQEELRRLRGSRIAMIFQDPLMTRSASPRPTSASTPIRTSSPAACASGWRSPSRSCTGRT